jgi:hypothetical protein
MSSNFTSNVRLQDDGQLAKEKVTFLKNNCLWGSILYLKVTSSMVANILEELLYASQNQECNF